MIVNVEFNIYHEITLHCLAEKVFPSSESILQKLLRLIQQNI